MKKICTVIFSFALLLTFTLPASATPANPTVQDIQNLKLYSKIANEYHLLESFGQAINNNDAFLGLLYNEIELKGSIDNEKLNYVKNQMANTKKHYNIQLQNVQSTQNQAKAKKLNLNDMNTVLNNYDQALSNLYKALAAIEEFNKTKNTDTFFTYLNYRKQAVIQAENGKNIASKGYILFFQTIQNY